MQADRKKLGILIIIAALILIFLILYFGFYKKAVSLVPKTTAPVETVGQLPVESEISTTTPSDKPRNYQQYNIASEPAHKTNATDLGKISMAFAERFGSFSNQSNYGNFTDLKIFMTDDMKAWADKYVVELRGQVQDNESYYGMVTTALTYEVKKFDEAAGQAEVMVTTRRRESAEKINGGEPFNQNLRLVLVKVNNDWLFDKAYWEK